MLRAKSLVVALGLISFFAGAAARAGEPATPPASFPDADAELAAILARVADEEEKFTEPVNRGDKEWVKRKLKHMRDVDQLIRGAFSSDKVAALSPEARKHFFDRLNPQMAAIDAADTAELKELLKIHRWITISEFGKEADGNAWLLVQHADDDVAFQREVLAVLTTLYPKGETSASNYAYLWDRVAVNTGNKQRYGTQGKCVGPGAWEPHAVEDPPNLEARRKEVGLQTMDEYKALFKQYGLCQSKDS